jgi:CRISPR type III-B/RAMP module-associated protein Cmr3
MNTHTLLLSPTDVLFFKDGRPMEGSSSGHGAAWPHPHILDAVLHHALHRSAHADIHRHRSARSGKVISQDRQAHGRAFGSLQSAGPFPVDPQGQWFFPRPADAQSSNEATTIHPHRMQAGMANSLSVKHGELFPLVSCQPPSKTEVKKWLSISAYDNYLNNSPGATGKHFLSDGEIFQAEHQIGIGIDPETGTQDGKNIYSASYLRLQKDWKIGQIACCMDKGANGQSADIDLIAKTFSSTGASTRVIVGGQQRIASVERHTPTTLPLPMGVDISGIHVRWTLLTPAIFPVIEEDAHNHIPHHPGGWLPTWIDQAMQVQLKDPSLMARMAGEQRKQWRERVAKVARIEATLVAFLANGRPQPITGWSLFNQDDKGNPVVGGAKSTHLAVPAGSVYYFTCTSQEDARKLATALNWHGTTAGTEIQNRRSTLFGEKGFGLGVCGAWDFHQGNMPT